LLEEVVICHRVRAGAQGNGFQENSRVLPRMSPLSYCSTVVRLPLAARSVVGHILFERIQFLSEIVDAPLQKIANGKHPQQLALIVNNW